MANLLLTEEEALVYLNFEAEEEIPVIEPLIAAVSEAVIGYLGEDATFFDEEGEFLPDDVPESVKLAAAAWLTILFQNRMGVEQPIVNRPPPVVEALLAHIRKPRMA